MDELQVLAHQLALVERIDLVHRLAIARHVHRHRNAELARVLDFGAIDLLLDRSGAELAAPRHAEIDQSLVRPALPVLGEGFERPLIGRLGVRHALRPAAGMTRADADLGEPAHVGFRVRLAAHVVAPRVHERHAGIDRLGGGEPRALEDVVRRHLLAEARDGREITLFRLVARETAIERVPHVPVGLDQARHDDHAVAVDLLPAALDVLADRDDLAVLHVHGAARDVAERGVHGHDVRVDDGELAARRQSARSAFTAARLRHQRRGEEAARPGRAERRGAADETTPAQFAHGPSPRERSAAPIVL